MYKRYMILVIFVLFIMVCGVSALADNRFTNPGAENGGTGWSYGPQADNYAWGHTGSYSFRLQATTGGWISQSIDLTNVVNITGYWYPNSMSGFVCQIDSAPVYYSGSSGAGSWLPFTINIGGYTGSHTVKFIWSPNTTSSSFLDDLNTGIGVTTKYIINATVVNFNENCGEPNVIVSLQNTNGNILQNYTANSNGFVSIDITAWTNSTYQFATYSNSLYAGITQFVKASDFTYTNGNYVLVINLTRFPITKFGSIFTIDSATRYNIFPSTFKIIDYENNYTCYLYSTTGALYYNYTYLHHYNVTGNVSNYLNKTAQVIPAVDNFRGYIEMDYTANMYYDITGQVFNNDINPIALVNAIVCWYYSNGSLMVGTNTDGAGYYHLKSPVNLAADTYNVIGSSLNYANTTYRLAIPTNFIDKGTLTGTTYYLTGCNIYLSQTLANNTSYAQFYVTDLFQSPIQYASVVITDTSDNTKVYSYTTDKYGQLKTPNLPIGNYVFQVTATNFQKSAGNYYNSVANAGQQILIKLAPIGWQNPTQTPTINPSGNPSYYITPTPNPSGNPAGNPCITPNPFTGNSTGSGWGDLANSYLSNFGVTDTVTQGIIIGLIITLFCGFCGAAFSSYVANGSSSIVIYSTIFFGAVGFICSCLIGFIPIWVLMVFILIIIAGFAFMKFGGDR